MVIVDHDGRIINFELGWTGIRNDAYIWRNSRVWAERGTRFEDGEYLIGDKG